MKKIILIVIFTIILLIGIFIAYKIVDEKKAVYELRMEMIDNNSPDIKLVLYRNSKKIKFQEISYLDGVVLCKDNNSYVNKFEISDNEIFKVKINDQKTLELKLLRSNK